MAENKAIIEFVEDLSKQSDIEEKKPIVNGFLNKLKAPIEYKKLLDRFDWESSGWFAELDKLLITIGYCARDDIIAEIKTFLRAQIKKINIVKYNQMYDAAIWNHIDLLAQNPDKIDWLRLSENPMAIELIRKHMNDCEQNNTETKIKWHQLSRNSACIDILAKNYKKIKWQYFLENSAQEDILKYVTDKEFCREYKYHTGRDHPQMIGNTDFKKDWARLSAHYKAIDLLEAYPDKINWPTLSLNTAAIDLLTNNMEKINWNYLSINPAAINLLKANQDKIDWKILSLNWAGLDLLAANQDKIDWSALSANQYDYYKEKLAHFDSMKLFQRSRLEIYENIAFDHWENRQYMSYITYTYAYFRPHYRHQYQYTFEMLIF